MFFASTDNLVKIKIFVYCDSWFTCSLCLCSFVCVCVCVCYGALLPFTLTLTSTCTRAKWAKHQQPNSNGMNDGNWQFNRCAYVTHCAASIAHFGVRISMRLLSNWIIESDRKCMRFRFDLKGNRFLFSLKAEKNTHTHTHLRCTVVSKQWRKTCN